MISFYLTVFCIGKKHLMKNKFTKAFCLLLCFGCFSANAQIAMVAVEVIDEIPVAETGTIKGHVSTTDNKPATEVNVTIKGLNRFAVTDVNGNFVLKNVRTGTHIISVSMVGLQPIEKDVTVTLGQTIELSYTLQETSKQLDEVIVTARKSLNEKTVSLGKIEINPMDLPQSIAVVGQGLIRDQQALRLSDVIRNVNGVYLATTRGNSQEAFSARGYGFSSSNMFKNGARVNAGAMPEMSSLEKVEVLKGSAAILYGNVAPGGIVNMVTKQPKFNFGGEVSMRAGSYDLYKPSFDVYGPMTAGIAYRVNGTFESANSFRNSVHSKRYYINPSLLFKLGKRTELLVQADYLNHEFTPDFGIGSINNTTIAPLPRGTFLGTAWSYAKTKQTTASTALKHEFNDSWKLNFTGSYQNYSRDYYSTERVQADATGKWARPLNRTFTNEDYYIAQLDLNGKFKTGSIAHTLLAGIDADRYYTTNYTYNQPTIYDTINILDPSKFTRRTDIPVANRVRMINTPTNRVGAYVQDLISLTSKLKLLAGVRFSYQKALPADSTNLITGANAKGVSKSDQAFSPRLGLVYRPVETTSFFASYSNSFSVNTGTDIHFNALSPSIIDQFEIGVKNDFFKGRLSANVTAYRIKNNNLAQTAQFAANGQPNNNTAIKELTGETTSDGIEFDLTGRPVAGLDIIAGYSYNYMRYTKTPDAKGNYVEGERLVNTPAHTANWSAFYVFKNKRLKGLKIGATAFYTGNRFGGWNNTIGQAQNYSRLIPVKGFTTIDISAGYNINRISLLAKVSNLANTFNYYVHENYSINPIAPRQVVGTIAYRF
jgi:iron complex outermembrane receptor protein